MGKKLGLFYILLFMGFALTTASADNIVYLEPLEVNLPDCGTASIAVRLNSTDAIGGFQSDIKFDPDVVRITDIAFVGGYNCSFSFMINNTNYYRLVGINSNGNIAGEQTLAVFTIECINCDAHCETRIEFDDEDMELILVNRTSYKFPAIWKNTTIICGEPYFEPNAEPTPTPMSEPSELTISSNDGLKLTFDEDRGVKGVSIDNTEIPMLNIGGGFSFSEISSTESINLIANPGFDNVSDSVPLNWTLDSGVGTVVYDNVEGHDSLGSVRIKVSGTDDLQSSFLKSDLIDAEPGTMYTFSAWGRSSGVDGKYAPAVRVVELDSSSGWIKQHNLGFDKDSDWEEKKTSFTTSSHVSKLYVYANIWESYGMFWVDDVKLGTCGTGKIPLESTVEKNYDGSITQHVTSSDIAFRFDYIPRGRYIEVHGDVQDLRGVDRAIQVQYILPVDATGWQWGDYIRKSREIESGVQYKNVYRIGEVRTQNAYPFTFVGEDARGLSLAVPMDVPRIYRIGYDANAGGYSIEYDFGLANCTDKIGAGHANFTFIVYKVDEPEWGFRAVSKKYYELYPEFFVKRNEHEGLWVISNQMNLPDVDDFGFAFTDSHGIPLLERIFNNAHGIYSMEYSEPWGYRTCFGDNSTEPSYREKIAKLNEEIINGTYLYEGVVTQSEMALSVLNTSPLNENGSQYISAFWDAAECTQFHPMNPDPDLPGLNRFDISYLEYSMDNESSSGRYALNWTVVPGNWSIDDTVSNTGNYSAKLDIGCTSDITSRGLCNTPITVLPSTQYDFSTWVHTYQCGGSSFPAVRAAEYTADGTYITQHNLHYGYGTNDWTQKSINFTTTPNTTTIKICSNMYRGYGTFWVDDVILSVVGVGTNLVQNGGFESTDHISQCDGLRIDSLLSRGGWARLENYRRSHWAYTDHPLVFSYDTKQPVLLGTLSQYEYLAAMHANMSGMGKRIDANTFSYAYPFYGHLIDVLGAEVVELQMDDNDASLRRTMSYQKTNRNLLQWIRYGNNPITHEEMEKYINNQMFYGMFPGIWHASAAEDDYWHNATLYERDRDLFKKCIPIIKTISAAGWDSVPYAIADNHNIKLERYGQIEDGLYYTVGNSGYTTESGVLSVDLSKLGFSGTVVEVKELVTNITSTQELKDGKVLITIPELLPDDTLVYRINR